MTEENKIQNIVTIEDAGPCKKKITIEIPEDAIKQLTADQYKDLRNEAELPGFRRGRAPMRLLEKRFGNDVSDQVKLRLLAEASDAAIKDNELDPLGEPNIDHETIVLPDTGAMKFDFEIEVRPEFDLPELEGIPVNKPALEVTDEQVDEEVKQLQTRFGFWAPKGDDAVIEDGDQIIADIIIKTEGIEEEDKLDNEEVFIRPNGFVGKVPVENFAEIMASAKAGDKKKIESDVPSTFFNEKYRGKQCNITITVKEIKNMKPAELNEELFTRLGMENEESLREMIATMAETRVQQQITAAMADSVAEYLIENTDFDLPDGLVADQAVKLLQRQYTKLLMQGGDADQIEKQMDELKASSEEEAKNQLKAFFIMDKVADKLEISVTEEEINGYIAQAAMQRGRRPEKMREELLRDGSLAQFSLQAREQKCIEKILETAKINDTDPNAAEEEKTKKPAAKKTTAKKTTKKTTKKKES